MSIDRSVPTVSKRGFDAIRAPLRDALRKWWKEEAQKFDAAVAGTTPVWEGMPEIDSKAVVKASPVIRRLIGADLDPRMIRRGGYRSFEDLVDDLLPKLRAACPDTGAEHQNIQQPSGMPTAELIDVRGR